MDIHFVQAIDNSRVVRVADPRRQREQRVLLAAGALVFVLLFAYTWQRYRIVQLGYRLQAAHSQRVGLEQSNRGWRLEEASLRDPQRIYTLAEARLGMQVAQPDQIVALDTAPAGARTAPVLAVAVAPRRMATGFAPGAPANQP